MSEIRASLIQDARMQSLASTLTPASRAGYLRRRGVAVLLAASLTIASVAGVSAASTAGGPLYGARIWLETATLPADANARALERLHQIDARAQELEQATRGGNGSAVAAAIAAYRDAIDVALTEAGTDSNHLANLEASLGLHVDVLETIKERAPEQAQGGLGRAIEASSKAVDKIKATHPTHGQPGSNGAAPGKNPNPSGSGSNSHP
ncbi:MAG: hypothetical protein ABI555_04960 [Chloroflexota bacterium]